MDDFVLEVESRLPDEYIHQFSLKILNETFDDLYNICNSLVFENSLLKDIVLPWKQGLLKEAIMGFTQTSQDGIMFIKDQIMSAFDRREYNISSITQAMIDKAQRPIKIKKVEYDMRELSYRLDNFVNYLEQERDIRNQISVQNLLDIQEVELQTAIPFDDQTQTE